MFNPFENVNRIETTDANATVKTIQYVYKDDNNEVAPVTVTREQGVKGRPKTSIEQDGITLFLTDILTILPVKAAKAPVEKKEKVVKEKPVKVEFTEEVVNVTELSEVRTELVYGEGDEAETVRAGRARPAKTLNGKSLSKRIKYVLVKPERVKKEKVKAEKTPILTEERTGEKAQTILVYSDGTEVVSGKGRPKTKLENGATLVKTIKVKAEKTERKPRVKREEGEEAPAKKLPEGEVVPMEELEVGDTFYRIDTITGEVKDDQGIMTISDKDEDVITVDLSIPMKVGNDTIKQNRVRFNARKNNVYRLVK